MEYQVEEKTIEAAKGLVSELGIAKSLNGWRALSVAVALVASMDEDDRCGRIITKIVYPWVADQTGTTASRVERAIRTAILSTWDRTGYREKIHVMFDHMCSQNTGVPKNGMVIYELAYELERRMKNNGTEE